MTILLDDYEERQLILKRYERSGGNDQAHLETDDGFTHVQELPTQLTLKLYGIGLQIGKSS